MQCNIDSISNSIKKLTASTSALDSSLAGDWNDEVKESYRKLNSQCKEQLEKIRNCEGKMRNACEKLSAVDVDEFVASAEATCMAIDGV